MSLLKLFSGSSQATSGIREPERRADAGKAATGAAANGPSAVLLAREYDRTRDDTQLAASVIGKYSSLAPVGMPPGGAGASQSQAFSLPVLGSQLNHAEAVTVASMLTKQQQSIEALERSTQQMQVTLQQIEQRLARLQGDSAALLVQGTDLAQLPQLVHAAGAQVQAQLAQLMALVAPSAVRGAPVASGASDGARAPAAPACAGAASASDPALLSSGSDDSWLYAEAAQAAGRPDTAVQPLVTDANWLDDSDNDEPDRVAKVSSLSDKVAHSRSASACGRRRSALLDAHAAALHVRNTIRAVRYRNRQRRVVAPML